MRILHIFEIFVIFVILSKYVELSKFFKISPHLVHNVGIKFLEMQVILFCSDLVCRLRKTRFQSLILRIRYSLLLNTRFEVDG